MARTKALDMLNGALLPKLMMFSLPLALTGILQLLFNAADVIVVGNSRAARRWPPSARPRRSSTF